jgi:hypothetical protein
MPIYSTKARDLTFEVNKNHGAELSANAGVPIAAAAGVTINVRSLSLVIMEFV